MKREEFDVVAAVIAMHPDRKIVGRTRLQKTIHLLQDIGLPTEYRYRNYFYGPYSDELQADIQLLDRAGIISETSHPTADGNVYYTIHAKKNIPTDALPEYEDAIGRIASEQDAIVLELAATYREFRQSDYSAEDAWEKVKRKKNDKWSERLRRAALELLEDLELGE